MTATRLPRRRSLTRDLLLDLAIRALRACYPDHAEQLIAALDAWLCPSRIHLVIERRRTGLIEYRHEIWVVAAWTRSHDAIEDRDSRNRLWGTWAPGRREHDPRVMRHYEIISVPLKGRRRLFLGKARWPDREHAPEIYPINRQIF